jgi:hypothetical protein
MPSLSHAFLASDLSRRRREVIAAARAGGAVIRDTDGTLLVMSLAEHVAAAAAIAELHGVLRALVATADVEQPDPSALGAAAWAADWPRDRRRTLMVDLNEALARAESLGDPAPAVGLLEASKPPLQTNTPMFDAASAFDTLSDDDRARLRGRRRTANR